MFLNDITHILDRKLKWVHYKTLKVYLHVYLSPLKFIIVQ